MNAEEMRKLVDRYVDAYSRMDIAGMLSTDHGGSKRCRGVESARRTVDPLSSERRQDTLSFETRPTAAIASIAFRAVLATDLPNGLQEGQVLTLSGRTECRFREGVISEVVDIA